MPLFNYTVQDKNEKRSSGTIEAADKNAAMKVLAEKDLIVVKLSPFKSKSWFWGKRKLRVKGEELLLFTQEMAAMLNAGISIYRALDIIGTDAENSAFKELIMEISSSIGEGNSFSESLKEYPHIFSRLYVSMIEAGEKGGELPSILLRLAGYIESSENLKKKVTGALYYPAIILIFSVIITAFIFIFGIPRIKEIYDTLGGTLPLPTVIFISIGNFLSLTWYYILPLLIIIFILTVMWSKTDRGQFFWDNLRLNNGLSGPIFRRLAIARFARTLSTLYNSGVPILQAMSIVSKSMGNVVMEQAVQNASKKLSQGEDLTAPLRDSKVFTHMAISMLSAGEESGTLGSMLDRLADFYEAQVEISIRSLTELIEPVIMIIIGVVIAIIILVLALPFMQVSSVLN